MEYPPIVVTSNPTVVADVERIAAAAGAELQVHPEVDDDGLMGSWRRSPLVLVDASSAPRISGQLPRRDGVVVVSNSELSPEQWAACVEIGASSVLRLGADDSSLVASLVDVAGAGPVGVAGGRVIAIVGAVGGAGATVLTVATALAAASSGRTAVAVDTDAHGAGLEVVAGIESTAGARWRDIAVPGGRLAAQTLYRALPALPGRARISTKHAAVAALSFGSEAFGAPEPAVVGTVLDAIVRAGDIAVVDVMRTPSPVADLVVSRADLTAVIAPADVRGCYGAARVAGWLESLGARSGLVVRGPSPGGLGGEDLASAVHLPLIAAMRPEPGLDRDVDFGETPGRNARSPLARAADAVIRVAGGEQ